MALIALSLPLLSIGAATAGVGSLITFEVRRARLKREMRQHAKDSGLELLGKELPDGFVFRGTGLNDPEIANVIKGTLRGTEMVVFTASFSVKDGNRIVVRTQTVVAFPNVRGLGSRQVPPTGDPNFYIEVAGDWLVFYYRAAVIDKEKLAGWCEKMHAAAEKLNSTVAARSVVAH